MDIDAEVDRGKVDITFYGYDGAYEDMTINMELADRLGRKLMNIVGSECGEKNPRVYAAEIEHFEHTLHAANVMRQLATRAVEMSDLLRKRIDGWQSEVIE